MDGCPDARETHRQILEWDYVAVIATRPSLGESIAGGNTAERFC